MLALWIGTGGCRTEREVDYAAGDRERGQGIFALAGGCGCHTGNQGVGGGGSEIATDFGVFVASNITSDRGAGLGAWSDREIDRAIRQGILPDGSTESPVMPYYRYAGMSDADTADLIAYLRTLPPVGSKPAPHRGELPVARLAYRLWRWTFASGRPASLQSPREELAYGAYLVDHVAICGDCHTPRGWFGNPLREMYLAGIESGPLGQTAPNITPHPSGVGGWESDDMFNLLRHGMLPNFDSVQGLMSEVVDGIPPGPGYTHADEAAIRAIVRYLRTIPAIDNPVGNGVETK